MNIKDLKSAVLKKRLNARQVCYRWHNKNKTGGNFGINLCGVQGKDYEISGYYDTEGNIKALHFGFIFTAGLAIDVKNLDDLFEFIEKSLLNRR